MHRISQLLAVLLLCLSLCSPVFGAPKNVYSWIFPNFDDKGSSEVSESATLNDRQLQLSKLKIDDTILDENVIDISEEDLNDKEFILLPQDDPTPMKRSNDGRESGPSIESSEEVREEAKNQKALKVFGYDKVIPKLYKRLEEGSGLPTNSEEIIDGEGSGDLKEKVAFSHQTSTVEGSGKDSDVDESFDTKLAPSTYKMDDDQEDGREIGSGDTFAPTPKSSQPLSTRGKSHMHRSSTSETQTDDSTDIDVSSGDGPTTFPVRQHQPRMLGRGIDSNANEGIEHSDSPGNSDLQITKGLCEGGTDSFQIEIEPRSDVVATVGSDVSLECQMKRDNYTLDSPAPKIHLILIHERSNCQSNASNGEDNCSAILHSFAFDSWNTTYSITHQLSNLQHNDSGTFTCKVEARDCQMPGGHSYSDVKSTEIKVYAEPFYGAQMGIILGTCFLLLAILVGLYAYTKKKRSRDRTRYQEMLASTRVQIGPAKVLELPQQTVYRPTTVANPNRKNGSLISGKSSFSSAHSREDI